MIHRLHFITGLVMLVLAATLAFTVSRRPVPSDSTAAHGPTKAPPRPAAPAFHPPAFPSVPADPGKSSVRDETSLNHSDGVSLSDDLQVTVDPAHPRHAELAEQAGRVERHARERVASLARALELTPAQQRRIFPILARASDSYDPAMTVLTGGSHAATAATADSLPLDDGESQALLQQELEPTQQDQLVEHSIADLMLWEEIIANLMRQLEPAATAPATTTDASLPPPGEPAAAEPAEPVIPPPSSRGGRNLFDATTPDE